MVNHRKVCQGELETTGGAAAYEKDKKKQKRLPRMSGKKDNPPNRPEADQKGGVNWTETLIIWNGIGAHGTGHLFLGSYF